MIYIKILANIESNYNSDLALALIPKKNIKNGNSNLKFTVSVFL